MVLKVFKYQDLTNQFWTDYDVLCSLEIRHSVHLCSKWLIPYINSYLKNENVYVLAVYKASNLIGCLPLQFETKRATRFYNFRILTTLGNGPSDFYDIPIKSGYEKVVSDLLISHLCSHGNWDTLVIKNIPADSQKFQIFMEVIKAKDLKFDCSTPNGFYYVDTSIEAWEDFERKFFNSKNKDILKSERRLIADNATLKKVTYTTDVYNHLIKNLDIYADRRKTKGQENTYLTERRKQFLKQVISNFEKVSTVELSVLQDQNCVAWAFQLDWIDKNTRYHWNHAFNENFKRYSPGKLVLKMLMIEGFNSPEISQCNHMRGLSGYKSKLVDRQQGMRLLIVDNPKSLRIKGTRILSNILRLVRR